MDLYKEKDVPKITVEVYSIGHKNAEGEIKWIFKMSQNPIFQKKEIAENEFIAAEKSVLNFLRSAIENNDRNWQWGYDYRMM